MKTEIEVINHLLQNGGGCLNILCRECPFNIHPESDDALSCSIYLYVGDRLKFAKNYTANKLKDFIEILQ